MANTLALKYAGTGEAAVYRNSGGVLSQIGNTFGASTLENFTAANSAKNNAVVQFKGKDDLYAVVKNIIYHYNSGTGDWDLVFTLPSATTSAYAGAISAINNNGVLTLVTTYYTASALTAAVSTDGTTWNTFTGAGHFLATNNSSRHRLDWGTNHIVSCCFNNPTVFFDVATTSFSSVVNPYTSGGSGNKGIAMAVKDNRLFAHGHRGDGNFFSTVSEYVGGSFINVIGNVTTGLLRTSAGGNPAGMEFTAMFVDQNNDLIVMGWQMRLAADEGLRVWVINTDLLTATEVTSSVVPATIRHPNSGILATTVALYHYADNVSVAGTGSSSIHEINLSLSSGPFQKFIWNGQASLMTSTVTAIPSGVALSQVVLGGGDRQYNEANPELNIYETAVRAAVTAGLQFTFKVAGDSGGGATKTVKLFYSNDGREPLNQATLVGAVTGGSATRTGNAVISVTANNTTDYTFIWDVSANGFSSGDPFSVMLTVE